MWDITINLFESGTKIHLEKKLLFLVVCCLFSTKIQIDLEIIDFRSENSTILKGGYWIIDILPFLPLEGGSEFIR